MIANSKGLFFPPPKQILEMPLLCASKNYISNSPNILNHSVFGSNKSPFLSLDRLSFAKKASELQNYQNLLWKREGGCIELISKDFATQSNNKFNLFKLSADSGDIDSMYTVAMLYFKGFGQRNSRSNMKQSFRYFSVAANRNHSPSQYCLALLLFHDFAVKMNLEKARRLIRKSSENGFSEAQYAYGLCLMSGSLFPSDEKKAYELFSSAAKQGNKNAKLLLGYSHAKGIGVKKDERKGLKIMKSVFTRNNFPSWGPGYYNFAKFLDELNIQTKKLEFTKTKNENEAGLLHNHKKKEFAIIE